MPPRALSRCAFGVFMILTALYLFFYNGYPVSTDEWMLVDAARSWVREGSFELHTTNELIPFTTPPTGQIMPALEVQPLAIYLSAPLIRLAEWLPGIGVVHTAWLLNVLVTAAAVTVITLIGGALGYRPRTATLCALIFGGATIVFPYALLYFREPLLTLCTVLSVLCGLHLRRHLESLLRGEGKALIPALGWLAGLILSCYAAALAKDAGLLILPLIVVWTLPGVPLRRAAHVDRRVWRAVALIAVGIILLAGLLAVSQWDSITARLHTERFQENLRYTPEALAAYLISPGFSLWAFSPVLLAGFWGAWRLWRARRWRELIAPLVLLISLAVGYAILHGVYWYGGLGWGSRFLVPATGLMVLWLLPVIEEWSQIRTLGRLGFGALLSLSVFIQALGVLYPITTFSQALAAESARTGAEILPWREGVWHFQHIPQLVTLREAVVTHLAPAWAHLDNLLLLLPVCLLLAAGGIWWIRGKGRPRWALTLLLPLCLYLYLRLIYPDPRYGGDHANLWQTLATLQQQTQSGDTLILENRTYRPFFLNYYTLAAPFYSLPYAGGELQRPGEEPAVISPNPEERADASFQVYLSRLAKRFQRWWFLTEYTPFRADRYRVTEHYLARHYFPAQEALTLSDVRLLITAPISAPPDTVPPFPTYRLGADFGVVSLVGADLPLGDAPRTGGFLPVSLLWRFEGFVEGIEPLDYSVNLSLVNAQGAVVSQRAVTPVGGFGLMTGWQPGGLYRDNHALTLPADLPPGEYELWVLVFDWRTGINLPLQDQPGNHLVVRKISVRE